MAQIVLWLGHMPQAHPRFAALLASLIVLITTVVGCNERKAAPNNQTTASLTLGAYTTPREAYGSSILPAFREQWRAKSGKDVTVSESYLGSGAQARAIIGGFEADIAALSLEPDIEKLTQAGLIKHDWKRAPHGGMVTRSVVVIGVREGNPKNIHNWQDLAQPGVEVLTPNVRTSGGAMWNILAVYGAALRGHAGVSVGDQAGATELVGAILRNVKIMDRGARESLLTFERGVGDAIITYENEILLGRKEGKRYDYVTPPSTILIENPIALVDTYVDRHGQREAAAALLHFVFTTEAQRSFAKYGLRPVLDDVARETSKQFAPVSDLFTIVDLGGWPTAQSSVFAPAGVYDRAMEHSRKSQP